LMYLFSLNPQKIAAGAEFRGDSPETVTIGDWR
jgi:hypothetical protein